MTAVIIRPPVIVEKLLKRGWSFVGPATAYDFMQSMSLVDDHFESCCMRDAVERERALFARPSRR
jgi:DNA-3-methyladenine glycosylase I